MPMSLYQRVEQAVNAYDPMALLAMCAPPDEYEAEILEIVQLLSRHKETPLEDTSVERLKLIVKFIFEIYFYEGCIYRRMAELVAKKILDPSITVAQPQHHVTWFDNNS